MRTVQRYAREGRIAVGQKGPYSTPFVLKKKLLQQLTDPKEDVN